MSEMRKCPTCAQTGKPVETQTVEALLGVSLRQVRPGGYLFCGTPACPTVYFSPDGVQTFTAAQVRERVYEKEPEADDVPICYCFRYTPGDIRQTSAQGRQAIVDDIHAGIQAGQCACNLRNPRGVCCLGNVRELVKQLERK